MDITGKTALVTGAGGGIGRASARMFAEQGAAKVVVVDIDQAALERVSEEIRALGARPIPKVVDLRDSDAVVRLFEAADQETGGLDIVYNNAGVMGGPPDFPDADVEKMVAAIQINLIAVMVGARVAIGQMRRRGVPGVIVNASSMAAFGHLPQDPAYTASKHGVLAFCLSCKPLQAACGIRVMAICPGITDTAIVDHEAPWLRPALDAIQMLRPEDIAEEIRRIVEDDSLAGDYVKVENSLRPG
jgi:NAD(P)-dependent dehydrogenase (short-subunit alcohol dehydrogenase family)